MGVRKPLVWGTKLAEESPELVCLLQGRQSLPMRFGLRQTRLLVSTANFSQLCLQIFPRQNCAHAMQNCGRDVIATGQSVLICVHPPSCV